MFDLLNINYQSEDCIFDIPLIDIKEWRELASTRNPIENIILQNIAVVSFEFTVFVGDTWAKRFASDGFCCNTTVIGLAHPILACTPRYDQKGNPFWVRINNKLYSSIRFN